KNRILDRAVDVKPPALAGDIWHEPEIEHRPVPREVLARRQALLLGTCDFSGKEAALLRPALLGARQLAVGRQVVLVGHVRVICLTRSSREPIPTPHQVRGRLLLENTMSIGAGASPIRAWYRAWSNR